MDATVLDEIQDTFFGAIDTKTSWGRNEIKRMYEAVSYTHLTLPTKA